MRVKQPLVLAELDTMIAGRTQPIAPAELRELWPLLKAALAGIVQSPKQIEKAARQKERRVRSYFRHADANDIPEPITGLQCALTMTGSGFDGRTPRGFAVNFALTEQLATDLGWRVGDRIEIAAEDGLWALYPGDNGWRLSRRSGSSRTLSIKLSASRLRLARKPTKGHAQKVCAHEARDGKLFLYPPTWGAPKP